MSSNQHNTRIQDIYALVDRLVQKLWDGHFKRDSKEVLDLIVRLITLQFQFNIRVFQKRLLQPISLEISQTMAAITFQMLNKVYERLLALTPDLSDLTQQSIADQKRIISGLIG